MEKTNIHFIGDSHTAIFLEKSPLCNDRGTLPSQFINGCSWDNKYNHLNLYCNRCCGLEGALAFNIDKRYEVSIKNIVSKIDKKDYLCFMFGEVDCRYKIFTYSQKNKTSIEEETKNVVKKYTDFIKNKFEEYKIILWGPHAQHINPNHPYIDCDSITRNKITKIFNEELKKICMLNKWQFISMFNIMINDNIESGYTDYFRSDTIHLKTKKSKCILLEQIII
jgi:hypothetical protein